MLLYHGSTELVEKPEIRKSKVFLDFGDGFYTTTSFIQAERWARIKMRRNNKNLGYVSVYEFDLKTASSDLNIEQFDKADIEWLTFVVHNRRGEMKEEAIDMHIGPVADDSVYQTIRFI